MDIRRKRAHDSPATADGYRVLVDRLWPRGVPTTDAEIDRWARAAKLRELPRHERKGRLTLVHARNEENDDAVVPLDRLRRGRRSA